MLLSDKTYFVFDAYGTLFRLTPLNDKLEAIIGDKASELLHIWRRKQLEYSWLRQGMKKYVPFNQITKEALLFAMKKVKVNEPIIEQILLPVYMQPNLIDGVLALLEALNSQGKTTAILSNGTPTMLNEGLKNTGIEDKIDYVLSVDEIGVYKPAPEVYGMATERLGCEMNEVIFFSSNQWDISGAGMYGFDCVWINQYQETREELPFGEVLEVNSIESLLNQILKAS